jgi:hypothetical protein
MQAVKKNLVNIIILVLLVIVALQRCEPTGPSEQPTIVRDTVLVVKESLTVTKPQLVETIESHDSIILKEYVPDTNYAKLVAQYQEVVNQLLAKNIMQDSVAIDSVGYVKITDTVQKNLIVGRSVQSKISYPIITETITLPAKKTNQLYVGGAILGSPAPNAIMGSALLKTRNDFLFGGSLSVNTYGALQYGVSAYWKLKLKK